MDKVFLFAGQGSQRTGMGIDFYEQCLSFKNAVDSLEDHDRILRIMRDGTEEELTLTQNTQKAMAVFAVGIVRMLLEDGIKPVAACGLSLGEYGALFSAGVFSAKEYVDILSFRGEAMAEASRGIDFSMSAVLGADRNMVHGICEASEKGYVAISNINCPGQIVICGESEAVRWAEEKIKQQGCKRIVRLNVGGPFHSRFMEPAGKKLKDHLSKVRINKAAIPVLSNATGTFISESDDIRELLVRQVSSTVLLEDNLRKLIISGYSDFIEIGPGKTMAGFVKRTAQALDKQINVVSIDSVEDYRKAVRI
ncbi:MAG: ACP S-malonyltransferase [Lachnospiraceae bacterium]|nr:ACP S-malonyltransferase [Lachnospiraceae bacterium]